MSAIVYYAKLYIIWCILLFNWQEFKEYLKMADAKQKPAKRDNLVKRYMM